MTSRSKWVAGACLAGAFLGLLAAAGYFLLSRRPPAAEPPPVVVDVVTLYPGTSAEEVESRVTVPLEVALSAAAGQEAVCSKSMPGLSYVRVRFAPGADRVAARQEVINRLQLGANLPADVAPQIAPASPGWEVFWYTLRGPRDRDGRDVYTPADLRTLQDWVLEREFRRLPGVADASACGGAVRRYEVRPDPERLRRYGVSLRELETALRDGNANVGGKLARPGAAALNVRGIGLLGGGEDPFAEALREKDPARAAARLRAAEAARLREVRRTVIATVNKAAVRLGDVVEGGEHGVAVDHAPRTGWAGVWGPAGREDEDTVLGVVWLRPGEEAEPALRRIRGKVEELNATPGKLLPGVRVEPFAGRRAGGRPPDAPEDCLWVRATLSPETTLAEGARQLAVARRVLGQRPGVEAVVSRVGRPEDGTDPAGPHDGRCLVRLASGKAGDRARRVEEFRSALEQAVPDLGWEVAAQGRDDFQEAFSHGPGQRMVKIFGPDLDELERLAARARQALAPVRGVGALEGVRLKGPAGLDLRVDREKCARWGVGADDVLRVLALALDGRPVTGLVEGEKVFDVVLRWPARLRADETAILNLPLTAGEAPRLRDCVSPSRQDPGEGEDPFHRPRTLAVYRENGRRLTSLRFTLRSGASDTLAELRKRVRELLPDDYRAEWSGR